MAGETAPENATDKNRKSELWQGVFAVSGIMTTLVIYGLLQEKEYLKYSLFLVFCNQITTSTVSAAFLLASNKALDPVAPIYKYGLISISDIFSTTCQYEELLMAVARNALLFTKSDGATCVSCGIAGIVLPESPEKVIFIKKGDAIALPFGVVTWWYNKDDTELVVLFLGETHKAHKAGEFTDFFLTGTDGIFTRFSTEFTSRAWDVDEASVKALIGNQTGNGIVKLGASVKMPEPNEDHRDGLAVNCLEAPLDVDIKGGGRLVVLNTKNLPLVGEVGFGADLVMLEGNTMCSPGFSCDSALQVTYVLRGSGRAQIVGVGGKRVLETTVKAGNLFIVPSFFVVSKIADPDEMEWFSIVTTPNPIFTHLAGKTSAWKSLSPQVLQAAFNVPEDVEDLFRS